MARHQRGRFAVKAQQVDGYNGKWLINLDFNPWSPRTVVYRIGGIAQVYDTQAEAEAVIAQLKAQGEQGALDKYTKPVKPAKAKP